MFAWGILLGVGLTLLFSEVGKAFAVWARKKWFNQEQK